MEKEEVKNNEKYSIPIYENGYHLLGLVKLLFYN